MTPEPTWTLGPWGPRFEPTCSQCVFLGRFDVFDLWFCNGIPTVATISARWESAIMTIPCLTVAAVGSLQEDQHFPGPHAADPVDTRLKCALRVAYLVARDRGLLLETWIAHER